MSNEDILLAEVEGPKGTAEIFEVPSITQGVIEVEYRIVFKDEERTAPSLGEAHLIANEMVGVEQGV